MSSRTLGPAFARVFVRELDRLVRLVEDYPDEADLWRVEGSVRNAPGTLALHLAGNLEHYLGAVLGGTEYARDREREFGDRAVPRAEIVARIRSARDTVDSVLGGLSDEELLAPAPAGLPGSLDGEEVSTAGFLTHLTWHTGWHLGQIDYHRRLLVGGDAL